MPPKHPSFSKTDWVKQNASDKLSARTMRIVLVRTQHTRHRNITHFTTSFVTSHIKLITVYESTSQVTKQPIKLPNMKYEAFAFCRHRPDYGVAFCEHLKIVWRVIVMMVISISTMQHMHTKREKQSNLSSDVERKSLNNEFYHLQIDSC